MSSIPVRFWQTERNRHVPVIGTIRACWRSPALADTQTDDEAELASIEEKVDTILRTELAKSAERDDDKYSVSLGFDGDRTTDR